MVLRETAYQETLKEYVQLVLINIQGDWFCPIEHSTFKGKLEKLTNDNNRCICYEVTKPLREARLNTRMLGGDIFGNTRHDSSPLIRVLYEKETPLWLPKNTAEKLDRELECTMNPHNRFLKETGVEAGEGILNEITGKITYENLTKYTHVGHVGTALRPANGNCGIQIRMGIQDHVLWSCVVPTIHREMLH